MNDKVFLKILRDLAKENGFKLTRIIDGIFELKKNNKKLYFKGKNFGLNSALSSSLSKNKAVTFEILVRNNIKAVPHYELYNPEMYNLFGDQKKRNKKRLEIIIKKEKLPLIIKPAEGSSGKNVVLVSKKSELNKLTKELFIKNDEIVLSPFRVVDHEFRVVVLSGKVELIFDKIRTDKREFRHNLCLGAKPRTLTPEYKDYKKLESLAKRTAKLLGLEFASVDIIKTEENGFEVLEVNSNVTLGHFGSVNRKNFEVAKAIYKKAFKKAIK